MPYEAGLIGAISLFKPRRIKHLVVAAITELVEVRHALLAVEGIFLLRGTWLRRGLGGRTEIRPAPRARYRRRGIGQASSVRPPTLLDQNDTLVTSGR